MKNKHWKRWTKRDDKKLTEFMAMGASYDSIATEMGRTYSAVVKRAHDLGLSKRNRKTKTAYVSFNGGEPHKIDIGNTPLPKFLQQKDGSPEKNSYTATHSDPQLSMGVRDYLIRVYELEDKIFLYQVLAAFLSASIVVLLVSLFNVW